MQIRRLLTYWAAIATLVTLILRHFDIPGQVQEPIIAVLLVAFLAGARAQHWVEVQNDYL